MQGFSQCSGSGSASESVIYLYGSGSGSFHHFHQQAKTCRKILISTVLWLYDFLSLKNDVPSKRNKHKNLKKKNIFVAILKVNDEKSWIRILIHNSGLSHDLAVSRSNNAGGKYGSSYSRANGWQATDCQGSRDRPHPRFTDWDTEKATRERERQKYRDKEERHKEKETDKETGRETNREKESLKRRSTMLCGEKKAIRRK